MQIHGISGSGGRDRARRQGFIKSAQMSWNLVIFEPERL